MKLTIEKIINQFTYGYWINSIILYKLIIYNSLSNIIEINWLY
jgi:hypothetical protein